MKKSKCLVALLATLSVGLGVTSCSSMLTSLSESLNALNEKLSEGVEIVPVPEEARAEAAARAEARKAAASTSASKAVAQAPAKTTPAQTTPPKNATILEFVGTPYTPLPAGTDGSVGTSGTYVLFGDWPQTIMAAGVTVDESKIAIVGAHTYYKGSDGAWYMKLLENGEASNSEGPGGFRYSDNTRVKNKYAKSYRYYKVEPIKWRVLTSNYNGSGKKLLLAEAALTNEQYCDTWGDYAKFRSVDGNQYSFNLDVTLRQREDGTYIHHNNYEHSRLRAFLNGIAYIQGDENIYVKGIKAYTRINEEFVGRGFLQTAFTPALQSKIAVTTVVNNSRQNSGLELIQSKPLAVDTRIYDGTLYYERGEDHKRVYYPKFTCNNTKDKVFVLNVKEVTRADYGFVKIPPKVTPDKVMDLFRAGKTWTTADTEVTYKGLGHPMTDFARGHGVEHFSDGVRTTWWLRTPALPPYFHRIIEEREDQEVGAVTDIAALGFGAVGNTHVGVVPAICVN